MVLKNILKNMLNIYFLLRLYFSYIKYSNICTYEYYEMKKLLK